MKDLSIIVSMSSIHQCVKKFGALNPDNIVKIGVNPEYQGVMMASSDVGTMTFTELVVTEFVVTPKEVATYYIKYKVLKSILSLSQEEFTLIFNNSNLRVVTSVFDLNLQLETIDNSIKIDDKLFTIKDSDELPSLKVSKEDLQNLLKHILGVYDTIILSKDGMQGRSPIYLGDFNKGLSLLGDKLVTFDKQLGVYLKVATNLFTEFTLKIHKNYLFIIGEDNTTYCLPCRDGKSLKNIDDMVDKELVAPQSKISISKSELLNALSDLKVAMIGGLKPNMFLSVLDGNTKLNVTTSLGASSYYKLVSIAEGSCRIHIDNEFLETVVPIMETDFEVYVTPTFLVLKDENRSFCTIVSST